MDDVVDLEEEKINKILQKISKDPEEEFIKTIEKNLWLKIKDKLVKGRRTGLSAIGLADTLASLGIKYGSEKSIKVSEEIYKQLAITAYKSSIDMAKDRGAFPIWDYKKETDNPFIERISNALYDNIYSEDGNHWIRYSELVYLRGRRNIALLTIPPSGTISLLAGISSGIEPVYQLSYKRRRKVEESNPNKSFKDVVGDWWEEYTVVHHKIKEWSSSIDQMKPEDLSEVLKHSPYNGATTNEIDPIAKVKLQGTIQRWIDHSISVTTNLPKGTTKDTVENIYIESWKNGCKGCTIYVDGSRDGVLVNDTPSSNEDSFNYHRAPKRPKELKAVLHKTKVNGINYAIIIGLYDDKPYEIFSVPNWNNPKNKIEGVITKVKKKHFNFYSEEENIEYLNLKGSPQERTENILISGILRHGTDPKYLTKWINKCELNIVAYENAVKRILRKYSKEDIFSEVCTKCGEPSLVNEGGCVTCMNCGDSKCN